MPLFYSWQTEHPNPIHKSLQFKVWGGETNLYALFLQVDQSGLFLPSRDYYLNRTANEKVRRFPVPCPMAAELASPYILCFLPRVRMRKVSPLCCLASQLSFLPPPPPFSSPFLSSYYSNRKFFLYLCGAGNQTRCLTHARQALCC